MDAPPETFLGYPCRPAWDEVWGGIELFSGSKRQLWDMALIVDERWLVAISKKEAYPNVVPDHYAGVYYYRPESRPSDSLILSSNAEDELAAFNWIRKVLEKLDV